MQHFENTGGKIYYYQLDSRKYKKTSMQEMILIGLQTSNRRKIREQADPEYQLDECNMKAPKDSKRQQKVFVINNID